MTQKYLLSCRWRGYKIYQYTSLILVGCYNNDHSWLWRYCTNNTFWQIDRYIQITLCKDKYIDPSCNNFKKLSPSTIFPQSCLGRPWLLRRLKQLWAGKSWKRLFQKECSTIQYIFIQCDTNLLYFLLHFRLYCIKVHKSIIFVKSQHS